MRAPTLHARIRLAVLGAALCSAALVPLAAAPAALAQVQQEQTLRVFLDCDRCDNQYIRTEITFVNYVRDRTEADVHLLITTQRTGGGREYTLTFIGRKSFGGVNDTLRYVSSDTDTDDERRAGLVKVIQLGLVRYVARTPLADQLSIVFEAEALQAGQTTPEDDPWNFWVFRAGVNGSYDAEESTNFLRLSGNLSANRVTEDWKIRLSLFGTYRQSNFDLEDETIRSTSRNGDLRGLVVKSLGPRWAAGAFASVSTSSFNNADVSVAVSPALEFNLFPYDESTRRELRFSYLLNVRYFDYEEMTTFGKTTDLLLHHALDISLEVKQPWGEAEASLEGSNYLFDFARGKDLLEFYQVELSGFVQVRLVRGLSLFAHGGMSWIRDQLFLPAEEATEEDILLRNRRLPTSYEFSGSLGLSYTFGSIYNNVVNPRFGS